MSHGAEKLLGEPIVIRIMGADMVTEEEQRAGIAADTQLLDEQPEPVFLIVDMSQTPLHTVNDVVMSTDLVARQTAFFKHPKIREVVIVTTSAIQEFAAKGMDSDVYGHVKTKVVRTREKALAYARSAIGPNASNS